MLVYSVIICFIYSILPPNLQKRISNNHLFLPLLQSEAISCIPDIGRIAVSGANNQEKVVLNRRFLVLMAMIISRSTPRVAPIEHEIGWLWLVRACHQLHYFASSPASEADSIDTKQLDNIRETCLLIHAFLKFGGNGLYLRYQDKFYYLLSKLSSYCSAELREKSKIRLSELDSLLQFVNKFLDQRLLFSKYYKDQEPYVLEALVMR